MPPQVIKALEAHTAEAKAAKSAPMATAQPVLQAQRRAAIMTEAVAQKWLLSNGKCVGGAKARMICLGWAGSNSGVFKNWDLKTVEVVKVELPARNARFNDKPIHDVNLLAKKIAQACSVLGYYASQIPLVIFGHSFGAMVGLHVARVMKQEYNYVPKMCVFGGCRPLHRWGFPMSYYKEDDDEMIQSMVDCGGMTKEMAKDKLLISSVLAGIKMDHLCMDRYVLNESAEKVHTPLWVIGGVDDPRSPPEQLPEWERYTTSGIQIKTFPGGHFFLKEKEADLLAWLSKVVEE